MCSLLEKGPQGAGLRGFVKFCKCSGTIRFSEGQQWLPLWPSTSHFEFQDFPTWSLSWKTWSRPPTTSCWLMTRHHFFFLRHFLLAELCEQWHKWLLWSLLTWGSTCLFRQLFGNDLPPTGMMIACRTHLAVFMGIKWGGKSPSSFYCEGYQNWSKILWPILRILWLKWRKWIFHILGGEGEFPFTNGISSMENIYML